MGIGDALRNILRNPSGTDIRQHYLYKHAKKGLKLYISDKITIFFLSILSILLFLSVFGPMIAPYEADQIIRGADGAILRVESPSLNHPLGTTSVGEDVLSRMIVGARYTMLVGLAGGTLIVGSGLAVGVTSGYLGGKWDSILMRFTDFAYGIPLIPTAIILSAFFGLGLWSTVALIGFLLWRGNARVFRSQVLQIKEREYVESAQLLGASGPYIVIRHILPNMMGMIILFLALGTGATILIAASLAFLGFMDPFVPSWGVMLRNAYGSGYMQSAWWWTLAPGLGISITVLSIIMLGRSYERVHNTSIEGGTGR